MSLKTAINTLLTGVGLEATDDLNAPDAIMAKGSLSYALLELPYDTTDFALDYDSMPKEVFNYAVALAGNRFQMSFLGNETLLSFNDAMVVAMAKKLIHARIVPNKYKKITEAKLSELLSFIDLVPQSLKDDLALLGLQASILNSDNYVLNPEEVYENYRAFKKRLIIASKVPEEVLESTAKKLFAKYGFSAVIPIDITEPTHINQTLRQRAVYDFQCSILNPDEYVITQEMANQDELDLRLAIIANKMIPTELFRKVRDEFINTYSITQSDLKSYVLEYIHFKALYRLQQVLIANKEQHPITIEDMDNQEASLITHLVIPKVIYLRVFKEVKIELGIEEEVLDEDIPEAVINYAKYKSALIHQPTAIINPRKYVINDDMVIRAKALALQSLPTLSLMSARGVSRIIDKSRNPEATTANTQPKYRLKVKVNATDINS